MDSYYVAAAKPASDQRAFLTRSLVDPMLQENLDALKELRERDYRVVGRPVSHIMDVTVDDATATVDDCVDYSQIYFLDARTNRRIDDSPAPSANWQVGVLVKTSDGWRVEELKARPKECSNGTEASPSVDGSS